MRKGTPLMTWCPHEAWALRIAPTQGPALMTAQARAHHVVHARDMPRTVHAWLHPTTPLCWGLPCNPEETKVQTG